MRRGRDFAILGVVAFAAWLFWPLGDARFAIEFDAEKTRAAAAFLAEPVAARGSKPPNVVLIVADDLGKHDIRVYGHSPTPTPHLAALAADGVTFTSGYATAPVCSPSRAALMTGRYQQRYGFEGLVHDRYPRNRFEWWVARRFFSTHGWTALEELGTPRAIDMTYQGMPPGEIMLSELLKKHGYATALVGKWHLGAGEHAQPLKRGFDRQYGFYDAFSLYADADEPTMVNAPGDYFADRYQWWRGRSGGSAIRSDGVVVEEHGFLTARIAEETVRWIESHRDRPFFAYVPFSAPHAPLQAPREYVDRFGAIESRDRRVYYGMIAALDDAVGTILAALDRLGLRDDTLVVFTSDNGAASYTGVVDNAPLKGGKLTNFEGGINVPMLARWPQRLAAGSTYAQAVSCLDLFTTIAAAAGVELPRDREYDGVDLLPFVAGKVAGTPHEALFWRVGGHRAARAGSYKLVSDLRTGSRALYDLARDPYEKTDLSLREPARADQLEQKLREWESKLAPPAWPSVMEYHFTDGQRAFVFPL
jgi:arylsulfatase A-like enzyme